MNGEKPAVIVTGSSGLIGYPLCERLSGKFTVFAFDREGPPHPPALVRQVPMDLSSDEKVRRSLESVRAAGVRRLAAVVHLAAYYDFSAKPSPKYREITVEGTRRLLEGLKGFDVEQFLFSSTMLVHAPARPGVRITEESPLAPSPWPYPQSKVDAEKVIRERRGAIPAVFLRIAGVYDHRCRSLPLAHQVRRIHQRRLTARFFPGALSRGQAFIHLEDLLDLFVRLIDRRAALPPELPLLAGESETLGYGALQKEIAHLLHGENWTTWRVPKVLAKAGAWALGRFLGPDDPFINPRLIDLADDHYALDISRARELAGWEPRRRLAGVLPKTIALLKSDPAEWYRVNELEPPREGFPPS